MATANNAALADYGVTALSLSTLQSATTAYETATPLPRNQKADKATITKNIASLFKQADAIMKKQIDKIMIGQSLAMPDVHSTFTTNRSIVSNATRGTQLKGKVTSAITPKGLKNATVTHLETGAKTITGPTGTFAFKAVMPGTASLTFTAEGFQDFTINNIMVKQGQLNNQKIVMVSK